jgi:hypothetical protein
MQYRVFSVKSESITDLAVAVENRLNTIESYGYRLVDVKYSSVFGDWNECRCVVHSALVIYTARKKTITRNRRSENVIKGRKYRKITGVQHTM